MINQCSGSLMDGTGCGKCGKCLFYMRSNMYAEMIDSIESIIAGIESIDHPSFGSVPQLKWAKLSLLKAKNFEFGKGKNNYLAHIGESCAITGRSCASSFVRNTPECMECSGYLIRINEK